MTLLWAKWVTMTRAELCITGSHPDGDVNDFARTPARAYQEKPERMPYTGREICLGEHARSSGGICHCN